MKNANSPYSRDISQIENHSMLIFSAFYYFINFVTRWSSATIFDGARIYNWPDPDFFKLSDVIFSSLSGSLLIFFTLYLLGKISFAKRFHINNFILPLFIVIYAEIDDIWYSTSNEHVRLYDIQLFIHTNMQEHMDLTLSDVRFTLIWIAVHLAVLTGAWLLIRRYAAKLAPAYQVWRQRRRAVFSLGGALLISANATSYGLENDHLWQAVSKRNLLGINVTSFTEKKHPDIAALEELYSSSTKPDISVAVPTQNQPPKSILFIAIEGFNPSYVDAGTMPFFTRLKAKGVSFENNYSSGNNTLLGTLGLIYGQSPAFFFEQSAKGQKSLFIESLNSAGYKTQVFGKGLESYRKINNYLANFTEPTDTNKETAQTIDDIASFIKNNKSSFAYYYYGGTHHPYDHDPAFKKFQPEVVDNYEFIGGDVYKNRDAIRNKYRNALAEADHNLDLLFSKIPWQNMIIVITGDHGEAMFENGRLSHSSSLERPQTLTPLFLYAPGIHPERLNKTTSHLDIFPTAFKLNGMNIPTGAQGSSLFANGPGMALVVNSNQNYRSVEGALISGKAKIIMNLENLNEPTVKWLYDDDDRDIRLNGIEGDVEAGFSQFKQHFLLNGCDLYKELSGKAPGSKSDQILLNNLMYCQ